MTTADPWTELSYTIVLSAMVGFVRFNIFLEMAKFFLTSPTLRTQRIKQSFLSKVEANDNGQPMALGLAAAKILILEEGFPWEIVPWLKPKELSLLDINWNPLGYGHGWCNLKNHGIWIAVKN